MDLNVNFSSIGFPHPPPPLLFVLSFFSSFLFFSVIKKKFLIVILCTSLFPVIGIFRPKRLRSLHQTPPFRFSCDRHRPVIFYDSYLMKIRDGNYK